MSLCQQWGNSHVQEISYQLPTQGSLRKKNLRSNRFAAPTIPNGWSSLLKALPPELRHGHFTTSAAIHHLPQQRVLIHYNKNSTFSPVCSYPRQVLKGLWKPEQSTKGKQISKHWPETITEFFSCTPGMQWWGPSLPITTISLTNGNSSFRSLLKDHFIKGTIS